MKERDSNNTLISRFKEYGFLPPEIEAEMKTRITSIFKPKGSLIVTPGQAVKNFFFIEKGLIRSFYKKEEQEVTVWFGYENVIFATIASFYANKVTYEAIECLEDCVFEYISYNDLLALYQKSPEVNTIGRRITEEYCVLLDERVFSFQTKSADERYNELLISDPEIIKRVPLGYIASYLGITQETLSRIRRKK